MGDLQRQLEGRPDGFPLLDRGRAMKDFLQDFSIGSQAFPGCHKAFDQNLGVGLSADDALR